MGTAEDVHGAAFAAYRLPRRLVQDLGTFIFCHHPLNLEQEIFLGRATDVMVEEDDLDAVSLSSSTRST